MGSPQLSSASLPPEEQSDAHLLAMVIGGDKSVERAYHLLQRWETLDRIAHAEHRELTETVGFARAARLMAALQLGMRATKRVSLDPYAPICSPADAFKVLGPRFASLHDEELHALYVGPGLRPLALRRLTMGNLTNTIVDSRQIFRHALSLSAVGVVIAHNHPSGDPTPSGPDREITRRVHAAGQVLGVRLLDHLVIVGDAYVSLAQDGTLPAWESSQLLTAENA